MEEGNSDLGFIEILGRLVLKMMGRAENPGVYAPGLHWLRQVVTGDAAQNWRVIVPVRMRTPSDSNNRALFASRI
jgi:hypothetical protein